MFLSSTFAAEWVGDSCRAPTAHHRSTFGPPLARPLSAFIDAQNVHYWNLSPTGGHSSANWQPSSRDYDSKYLLMENNTDALWASCQFASRRHFCKAKGLKLKFESVFYIQISIWGHFREGKMLKIVPCERSSTSIDIIEVENPDKNLISEVKTFNFLKFGRMSRTVRTACKKCPYGRRSLLFLWIRRYFESSEREWLEISPYGE